MSEEVITSADIDAASEWAFQLASKIVLGNHGCGNAAVLIDRALEIRATAAEAREAKLREALERLRDCDWVITLPDRMDAVRDIARAAIEETSRG